MAYFGRKAKKPLQTPGAGSGARERGVAGKLSGLLRTAARGRQERFTRASRSIRTNRAERSAR